MLLRIKKSLKRIKRSPKKNVEINDKDKQIKTLLSLDSVTMVSRFMELDVTNRQIIAQLENDIVDLEVKAVEADKNLTDAMEEVRQSKEEGSKRDIGGKYLVFESSRSVKMRGFSFLSLHAF